MKILENDNIYLYDDHLQLYNIEIFKEKSCETVMKSISVIFLSHINNLGHLIHFAL